ncbi:MAG: hypothetical protein IPJ38_07600 [Dechloromonas sp.]|uniref:Uncharacterized protein n=1 Tax=Candidatus Dechloromonas phosphorivorans TaxID=2899244 RepID=A0A935MQL8_9RHOO|nr:hypothetical protein [Candidatus Dechloromonas phosphorivorans]
MNVQAAYGLLAHGLIFGALVTLLPLGQLRARAALLATGLALVAGIAPMMHGTFGTPSLTLLQLALLQLTDKIPTPLSQRPALYLVLFGLIFYPTALGWGPFDPYALGYQPLTLLAALIPIAVALWWRRQNTWLIILALDLAGYASGLFPNLWDALLDPLLFLVAVLVISRGLMQRVVSARLTAKDTQA